MEISVTGEIILCVGYAVIFIANIVVNSFVCAVVVQNKKLYNFTSILIVNMAISDLTLGVSGMIHIVLEILFLMAGSSKKSLMCGRLNVVTLFSASVSIYTMCVLAFDRYLSIVKPVLRRTTLTKGKLKLILPAIWIVSLALFALSLYFNEHHELENEKYICWETLPLKGLPRSYRITIFVTMYLIPMCVIVYFLGKVFVHLWFHERKNPSTSLVLLKSRLHLTQILSSVILLFNICWLPWFILELGSGFGSSLVLRSGLALLAVAQSSLNPFLYSFQSQNFRQHLRKIAKRRKSNPVVIGMGVTKRTGKLFG